MSDRLEEVKQRVDTSYADKQWLIAEVERLQELFDTCTIVANNLGRDIERDHGKICRLKEIIARYGHHDKGCDVPSFCVCGLAGALEGETT